MDAFINNEDPDEMQHNVAGSTLSVKVKTIKEYNIFFRKL